MSDKKNQIPINEVLQFSDQFQGAIIGHMMNDYAFYLKCRRFLEPSHFSDPINQVIVDAIYKTADEFNSSVRKVATAAETLQKLSEKFFDAPTLSKYRTRMDSCKIDSMNMNVQFLSERMTSWIKLLKLKNAMIKAEQMYNKKDYNNAIEWLRDTMSEIAQADFERDDKVVFDILVDMAARNEQFKDCCTLGHPEFDELLIKDANITKTNPKADANNLATLTTGGLAPGDTTILMGTSNAGKTSTVITIIGHNIKMGKKVLYITHEQKFEDIRFRLYQSLTGLDGTQLSRIPTGDAYKGPGLAAQEVLRTNLTYIPYNKPGQMYVENVIKLIEIEQTKLAALTGKGYDLVVVDYPGKLKSRDFNGKGSNGWEEKVYVYDQFVNAAEHYRFHALLPVQANREAFKVNRGDAKRLLDMGDVADAYGIMQIASNVITINRSPDDAGNNRLIFYVAKCRSHEPFWVFMTNTKFDVCRTHGWDLQARALDPQKNSDPKVLTEQLTSLTGASISTSAIIQDGIEVSNVFNQGLAGCSAPPESIGTPGDGVVENFESPISTTQKINLLDIAVQKGPVDNK